MAPRLLSLLLRHYLDPGSACPEGVNIRFRKLRTWLGAQSGSILILMVPSVVFTVTVRRSSSSVAPTNGSSFFFSMVALRMRTGFSAKPSAAAGDCEISVSYTHL